MSTYDRRRRGQVVLGCLSLIAVNALVSGCAPAAVRGPGDEASPSTVVQAGTPSDTKPTPGQETTGVPGSTEWEQDMEDETWSSALGLDEVYSFAVVLDSTPDEALRRIGAAPDDIFAGTWADLQAKVDQDSPEAMDQWVLAAFGLNEHTLLVEGRPTFVNAPFAGFPTAVSNGTTAVCSSFDVESMNNFQILVDGEEVANYGENGDLEPLLPAVGSALTTMGEDADQVLNVVSERGRDLELLGLIAGVQPRASDVTGVGRLAVIPMEE